MSWTKNFNVGDEIVCTCGHPSCPKEFTVININDLDDSMEAKRKCGTKETFFDNNAGHLIQNKIVKTKLYKALK